MISKGHHYVINFGIVINFYISIDISIDPAYPGSLAKDLSQQVNSENLGSPFSIDPQAHYPLWVLIEYIWNSTYEVFVFYFHHPCLFYPQHNLSLKVLFYFHFPHFYFAYNFVVLQKSAPQPAVLWWYTLKGHKQRAVSLEGVTFKYTKLPFGSVSTSVIPSRPR